MESLYISQSPKTPMVEFSVKGELRIEGRSIPENTMEFYQAPLNWLKDYAKEKPGKVNLKVILDHFNTSSSKLLLDMFKVLEHMKMQKSEVNIYWHYASDNENILEAGEDYKSILKVPFHIVKV